jgi:hypothetical protein
MKNPLEFRFLESMLISSSFSLSTNCSRPRIQKKLLDGKCINKTKQKKKKKTRTKIKETNHLLFHPSKTRTRIQKDKEGEGEPSLETDD